MKLEKRTEYETATPLIKRAYKLVFFVSINNNVYHFSNKSISQN